MASRIYDFSLGAAVGAAQRMDVMASRVKLLTSAYAVQVRTEAGDMYTLLPGQGFTLPAGQKFREVVLSNTAALANAGTIFIGDETFEDSRITGTVDTIDSGKTRTLAGQAFMGRAVLGAGAGMYGALQLWNPAGSVKRVVIEAVSMSCTVAGNIVLTMVSVAQSNAAFGKSKLGGGADSTGVIQTATNASLGVLNPAGKDLSWTANLANATYSYSFREPVVLTAGYGLMVVSDQNASAVLQAMFEFFEE